MILERVFYYCRVLGFGCRWVSICIRSCLLGRFRIPGYLRFLVLWFFYRRVDRWWLTCLLFGCRWWCRYCLFICFVDRIFRIFCCFYEFRLYPLLCCSIPPYNYINSYLFDCLINHFEFKGYIQLGGNCKLGCWNGILLEIIDGIE